MPVAANNKQKPVKARIKRWVEALRSGKYKQVTSSLRSEGNKRCCLGVACDVFRKDTKKGSWKKNPHRDIWFFSAPGQEAEDSFLPEAVRAWLGVEDRNPSLTTTTVEECGYDEEPTTVELIETASVLNDEFDMTFDKIADAIEQKYLKKAVRAKAAK